ncbi:MAG: NYN domain-containing protein [Anaerolineae bacterium]|nr:NYN domain-containing protein [Anaerolineae bacterium]MDW7990842.1 NYN domain-containing protein [Anaerolineae bacterium]
MSEGLVALFVDYENLHRSVQDQWDEPVQWQKVLGAAERWGRVVIRRAYADWATCGQQKELLSLGFELIHVAGHGKNAADLRLTIDVVDLVAARAHPATHIVLASGDSDFTDLVHYLHTRGKFVVGVGVRATSAASLIVACDEFVYYDDLVEKVARRSEEREVERYLKALAPKVRMTASPYRPWIILQFYQLIQQNPGLSLKALSEKLRAYYQEHYPEVPPSVVNEVVHQLFHTYSFEFGPPERGQALWDRVVSLKEDIRSGADLLEHCDRGLLQILSRNLRGPIQPAAAAELLYGRSDNPRLLEYVRRLIESLGTT